MGTLLWKNRTGLLDDADHVDGEHGVGVQVSLLKGERTLREKRQTPMIERK